VKFRRSYPTTRVTGCMNASAATGSFGFSSWARTQILPGTLRSPDDEGHMTFWLLTSVNRACIFPAPGESHGSP
jgi:hypothetical protein